MWFLFKLSNKLFFIKGKIICLRVLSLLKKAYLCRNNHT